MGLYIVRGDLTKRNVDAIVCTANSNLYVGGALGRAMIEVGGQQIFDDAAKVGHCDIGSSVILPGHNLSAKYIIHSVGPIYERGSREEIRLLKSAYLSALNLAKEKKLDSIEFPLISTGSFGFPKELGCKVALATIREFLKDNDLSVGIVINRNDTFTELADLLHKYKVYDGIGYGEYINHRIVEFNSIHYCRTFDSEEKCGSIAKIKKPSRQKKVNTSWEDSTLGKAMLKYSDIDFSKKEDPIFVNVFNKYVLRTLNNKIANKYSDIYRAANVSKSVFSNIYCRDNYVPTRLTIYSFAVAMKLNRLETKELLESGDYPMRDNDTLDSVMGQILDCGKYDIFEVNHMLGQHNLPYLFTE